MSRFLIIRCEDQDSVDAIVEILRAELRQGDWYFKMGTGTDAHYTASDVAEDASAVTVIDTEPQETEED
jgi:hypothetical protein